MADHFIDAAEKLNVTTEIKRTSVVMAGSLYWPQTEAVKLKINTTIAQMNRSECDERHAYKHETIYKINTRTNLNQ